MYSCTLYVAHYLVHQSPPCPSFFFFNDTATTEIYTLSLHDALPISPRYLQHTGPALVFDDYPALKAAIDDENLDVTADRKSTRLNSSHSQISYAVFCLKKKKKYNNLPLSVH